MEAATIDVAGAWHELGQRLRAYVSRRVNPADADDIVQSVMVKLLERRNEIESSSVRAWLFTVTRNAVAEYYRTRRPMIDLDAFGDVPENDSSDRAEQTIGALSDCLQPMLRTLAEADAGVLRKVDLEGASQVALAAAPRRTAVHAQVARAARADEAAGRIRRLLCHRSCARRHGATMRRRRR